MCKLSGKRPVGRPRRRRVDFIEHDARDLVLDGAWTERVENREEWL